MTPERKDVYDIITTRIMELLDKGIVPWHRPWRGGRAGKPKNLASGKDYRGVNTFLLHCASMAAGYDSPYWLTFKQAKERGGNVRKGEHGMPVVFWNWVEKEKTDSQTGATTTEEIPFLRYYTVFNVEQCEVKFRGHLTNFGRVLFRAEMHRLSPDGHQRRGHQVREDVFDYPRWHPRMRKTHFVHRRYSA